jgi:hypothetical protein
LCDWQPYGVDGVCLGPEGSVISGRVAEQNGERPGLPFL